MLLPSLLVFAPFKNVSIVISIFYEKFPLFRSKILVIKTMIVTKNVVCRGRVVKNPDSSSGVSDQQRVGSSPSLDTCVYKRDT